MKKVLLSTTALAAVSALAVTSASAQTLEERIRTLEESMLMGMPDSGWDVQVSGYMVGGFFLLDQDSTPAQDLGSTIFRMGGGEIQFRMSTVLDNGMTVGGRVELEDVQSGDQIDETYMYASGGFGEVRLGADDSASNLMHYTAPWFGLQGVDGPNFRNNVRTDVRTDTNTGLSGDANKITYFTPRFSGFQFGISYVPTTEASNGGANNATRDRNDANIHDFVSVGANFTRDLGGFTLGTSAGWESGSLKNVEVFGEDGPEDDPVEWHIGGTVSSQGFTFGGAYFTSEATPGPSNFACAADIPAFMGTGTADMPQHAARDDIACTDAAGETVDNDLSSRVEQNAWSVGVKYDTGPWSFSAGYFEAEGDGYGTAVVDAAPSDMDTTDDRGVVLGSRKPQSETIGFGATYAIGPGVTVAADLQFTEDSDGLGDTVEATSGGLIMGISF